MLIDSILTPLMPFIGLLMIAMVASQTGLLAGHTPPRGPTMIPPAVLQKPAMVDGTILEISLPEQYLTVSTEGREKKFSFDRNTVVQKDKESATLQSLARGDRVTLHFADQNQDLIKRIEAFSSL